MSLKKKGVGWEEDWQKGWGKDSRPLQITSLNKYNLMSKRDALAQGRKATLSRVSEVRGLT